MRTKKDFPKDSKGRTILANAEDMREWVELGFDEQRRNRSADIPFPQDVIDLTGCALYTSCSKVGDNVEAEWAHALAGGLSAWGAK